MRMTLADVAVLISGELIGEKGRSIERIAPLHEADGRAISFLADETNRHHLETTQAAAVIVPMDVSDAPVAIIRVISPARSIISLLEKLHPTPPPTTGGIHETAVIHETATLGSSISIGPYAVVGAGTNIGDGVSIGAGSIVSDKCRIGQETWIYPGVMVYGETTIGRKSILHSGVVIGCDGFGYHQEGPEIIKMPQVGVVEIGDRVEIGANTTVDCATMGITRIGQGTKIDNLVQIGHNVTIGDNVRICAQVGVAGSTTIEDGVIIAGQAGLMDHITVGNHARIGGQAGVTKNVPANTAVSGYPARPHQYARKLEAYINRLPGLLQQLRDQQQRIEHLENKLQGEG